MSLRPSEPGAGLFQELNFLLGGFPAQDAISMRIPSEPLNDGFVLQLEIEVARDPILSEQLHCDFVNFQGFAVHEGHIEEASLDRTQSVIRSC